VIPLGMEMFDIFAQRSPRNHEGKTAWLRFNGHLQNDEERASFAEIEDIRHLYAHNFAGHADKLYFCRRRHVLALGKPTALISGGQFNGERLQLDLPHLRFYSQAAQKVLNRFS
jgi:hypothetical protein